MRTDEQNVSVGRVFFGGINVFLNAKVSVWRHLPRLFERVLDSPWLLRLVSGMAVRTRAEDLGDLTVSMLRGEHGPQREEVERLVSWLTTDVQPDVVNLTNVLLSGVVHEVKRRLGVPVLGTLQGDDVFIEFLPPRYRSEVLRLIREHCQAIDGFISTSAYYADFMADYLAIPRARIHVVHPGLNLTGHGGPRSAASEPPYTIGYFARICPEKGLHHLVDAFCLLAKRPGAPPCRLRISGWLGNDHRTYLKELHGRVEQAGLAGSVEHVDCPDHASKVRFLQSLDVLSVPTTYREPKGLYVLEALANGVPVVQPRHGSFPELIEATGGGLLVEPDNPAALADALHRVLTDAGLRHELGQKGKQAVHARFQAARMAQETADIYEGYLRQPAAVT